MQYFAIFMAIKKDMQFTDKNCDIFQIFAQNKDFYKYMYPYSMLLPKKKMKRMTMFYYMKVGL